MTHNEALLQRIRDRVELVNTKAAGTVCGDLQLSLESGDVDAGVYHFLGRTTQQMRNIVGTLHGGCAALLMDQAMGSVANSLFANAPHAPTSQLNLHFHRPMTAGNEMRVQVRLVNVSKSQIHLFGQIYQTVAPDKLCVSATAVFFRTEREKEHEQ